jgi:hypothetical protein
VDRGAGACHEPGGMRSTFPKRPTSHERSRPESSRRPRACRPPPATSSTSPRSSRSRAQILPAGAQGSCDSSPPLHRSIQVAQPLRRALTCPELPGRQRYGFAASAARSGGRFPARAGRHRPVAVQPCRSRRALPLVRASRSARGRGQNGRRCPDPRVFSRRLAPPRAETRPGVSRLTFVRAVSRADADAQGAPTRRLPDGRSGNTGGNAPPFARMLPDTRVLARLTVPGGARSPLCRWRAFRSAEQQMSAS